jgi:hypothetical protein
MCSRGAHGWCDDCGKCQCTECKNDSCECACTGHDDTGSVSELEFGSRSGDDISLMSGAFSDFSDNEESDIMY